MNFLHSVFQSPPRPSPVCKPSGLSRWSAAVIIIINSLSFIPQSIKSILFQGVKRKTVGAVLAPGGLRKLPRLPRTCPKNCFHEGEDKQCASVRRGQVSSQAVAACQETREVFRPSGATHYAEVAMRNLKRAEGLLNERRNLRSDKAGQD